MTLQGIHRSIAFINWGIMVVNLTLFLGVCFSTFDGNPENAMAGIILVYPFIVWGAFSSVNLMLVLIMRRKFKMRVHRIAVIPIGAWWILLMLLMVGLVVSF